MKLIEQYHKIEHITPEPLQQIEKAGRTCYKSEDRITQDSAEKFATMLIKRGHEAMIEFADMTVRFITDRGVTHELVRHRHCSFAQESTRYVKYDGEMEFIKPIGIEDRVKFNNDFLPDFEAVERLYKILIKEGYQPQQARQVLNNSIKTEIVVKANFREWRHIFKLRCDKAAHPQMRDLMLPLLKEVKEKVPVIFDDLGFEYD